MSAALASLLFGSVLASAAELRYGAPASCPTEAEVRARWAEEKTTAPATLVVDHDRDGFVGTASRDAYQRVLHDPSCAALVEALLLALGSDVEPVKTQPAPAATVPARVHFGARVETVVGLQPGPTPGLSLLAGVARGPWRAVGYGFATAPLRGSAVSTRDAVFHAFTAGVLTCVMPGQRFAAGPCVGSEVGVLRGVGRGVDDPRRGSAWFVAPVVALHGEAFVTQSLALTADLGVAFPSSRAAFEVAGEPVHRAAFANGRVAIGITWWP